MESIENYRQKFNKTIRDYINSKRPSSTIKRRTRWPGLGDILTAEVNFRRIGATVGVIAPWAVLCYGMSRGINAPSEDPSIGVGVVLGTITYFGMFPATGLVSTMLGGFGYLGGEKIDYFLGDKESPRYNGFEYPKSRYENLENKLD